jgi:peptidyl-prolyl cis-trans isomerase D
MIKLIHRHNKIITYVFLFVAFCFMFSGIGLDILQGNGGVNQYAIKVNNREISPIEFERTRENLRERYRRMFGDNFDAIAKSFNLNVTQQTVDSLVDSTLLSQEATRWGFAGSDEGVTKFIRTQMFAGREVSREALRGILQSAGMNYRQFSAQLKEDLARSAFVNVVRDVSFIGQRDVESQFIAQETAQAVITALVQSSALTSQVPAPTEEALKSRYAATATTYEIPAQVSYEYVEFNPKDFEKDVGILPQDLEFYYTENPSKFKTPEQVKVRAITLLFPKTSDPAAMAAVKEKAKKVHEEAVTGKPFIELVQQYSDDLPSKLAGGDKGWVQKGQGDKAFDKAAFAAQVGAIAELIETNYGFQIVKVEEKKQAGVKPFAEVKASIENEIRSREAPSYAAAKAQELVAYAKKNNVSLAQAAETLKLPAPKVAVLAEQGQAQDPIIQGLTKRAMQIPAADRRIATTIDLGDKTAALRITEFKEPSIQPFEVVKDKVLQAYNKEQAEALAEKNARELLAATVKDPNSLAAAAATKGYKVTGPFDLSRAKPSNPAAPGLPSDLASDVTGSFTAPRALARTYKIPEGYLVAVVTKLTRPDLSSSSSAETMKEYRENATESSQQQTLKGVVTLLKSKSKIDVDAGLLAANS